LGKKEKHAVNKEMNLFTPEAYHICFYLHSIPAVSVLFFSLFERKVLMALVFYCKDMLQKVTMQGTLNPAILSFFFATEKPEPS